MKNKVQRPIVKGKLYKRNYVKSLIYKSVFVIFFILILLLIKKVNLNGTNKLIDRIKNNINYEFNIVEDGKKIYRKAQNLVDNSIKAVGVFSYPTTPNYMAPLSGSIYKSYNEKVIINNEKVKNEGTDIKSEDEEPKAIINGVVKNVESRGNKGYFITIEGEDIEIVYGYLSKAYVSEGSNVKAGDLIGLLGTNKDGNKYLRIEIYKDGNAVDPMDYIDL